MADTDDNTTAEPTTDGVGEQQDTTPPDIPAGEPAPEPTDEEPAVEDSAVDETVVAEPTELRLQADAETLEAAAIPPTRAQDAPDEAPRFGAQFSSPEPTTVTARPRRRATRPALAADPGSVEPAPAAPPTAPAFIAFVAAPADAEPAAPATRRRSRRTQAETPAEPTEVSEVAPEATEEQDESAGRPRRSRSRRKPATEVDRPADDESVVLPAPDAEDENTDDADTDTDADDAEDRGGDGAGSRRRRRGRRGRGRGRTGEDDDGADDTDAAQDDAAAEGEDAESTDDDGDTDDGADASGSGTRRRRRRRRRGGESTGSDTSDSTDDDRPERAGRNGRDSSDDAVKGVAGSTRLEAKRQRRRDGRDTGRRRAPILSESEFLARREAVDRSMVIRQQGERTQIAVLEDDVLVEHYVTQAQSASFAGNVYLGRVQNVLPSMEAAFVDVGKGRNAVLYAGEVNWETAGLSGKSRSIEQALKSGDKVLVQVTKDPIGHKGARLTQQINLPGRFLVYVPGGSMTGISRKLPDNERQRLKDILKKIVPEDAGVIIRTAAEGASEEELTRDVARLQAQWEVIQTKAASASSAPTLLYGEPDLAIRVIRDVFNEDFKRLVVQGDDAWDTVEAYVAHVSPELSQRLERFIGNGDVFRDLRIDEQLLKALDRKVWLPSGGSLVIDRTEAMTVVDVNTGKFTGSGGNLEQTVTRNNIEAAEEIVRQLRLRDIGGMIVIDFIDMVLESNRDLVLRRLTECLGRDRTKHQVAEVTSLGLVQMTRKRVGQGLLEVFSENCEHCRGRGVVVHLDPVDEKKRSGGQNGNGNGNHGGHGTPGNGGQGNGGHGNGNQGGGRGRGDDRPTEAVQAAPAEDDAPATGPEGDTPQESTGRSGRRNRGRRNRGRSGDDQVAEDAAVLAASHGDDAQVDDADDTVPDLQDGGQGEKAGAVEPDEVVQAVAEVTQDEVEPTTAEPASTEPASTEPASTEPASTEPAAEEPTAVDDSGPLVVDGVPPQVQVQDAPVAVEQPAEQPEPPVVDEAPAAPVARPRRRRAASRPAGPPVE
ncbi:ribonuclease E [Klenkia soli]|uniref:Ribonuclease E n=1 Tax=Klenkia soli TaxID=1052260 RepID=A0A1H0KNI8_9ACTN|nr:Rne/Rng family ribonuclease [Klenkia soli]SDO57498.1 ribonuclease E [Klenkia soli]